MGCRAMDMFRIAGIGIIGAVAALVVRRHSPELGMLVSLGCAAVILASVFQWMEQAAAAVEVFLQKAGLQQEYGALLLKTLGICILTQIASEACRDSGEGAIAAKVELAGKLAVLMLSLPLFGNLLTIALSLLSV